MVIFGKCRRKKVISWLKLPMILRTKLFLNTSLEAICLSACFKCKRLKMRLMRHGVFNCSFQLYNEQNQFLKILFIQSYTELFLKDKLQTCIRFYVKKNKGKPLKNESTWCIETERGSRVST